MISQYFYLIIYFNSKICFVNLKNELGEYRELGNPLSMQDTRELFREQMAWALGLGRCVEVYSSCQKYMFYDFHIIL